jgi:hypothetical protein
MKIIYCKKCKEDISTIWSERTIKKYSKINLEEWEYNEIKDLEEEISDEFYCLNCKTSFNEEDKKSIFNMIY